MDKIKYTLKLAKECTYADEMTEGAREHLRREIDEALQLLNSGSDLPDVSGSDLPDVWMDWNTLSLDQMVEHLRKKYAFSSSGDAKCIYQ